MGKKKNAKKAPPKVDDDRDDDILHDDDDDNDVLVDDAEEGESILISRFTLTFPHSDDHPRENILFAFSLRSVFS
jgi:hypothetical protein